MRDMAAAAAQAAADRFSGAEADQIRDFFRQRAADLGVEDVLDTVGRATGRDDQDEDDPDDEDRDDDDGDEGQGRDMAAKAKDGKGAKAKSKGRGNRGQGVGRGGRSSLPPGIAKNLERGKSLPPGIARNYLPDGLEEELPVREGQSRVVIDDDVVLVDDATNVVIDILQDVLSNR